MKKRFLSFFMMALISMGVLIAQQSNIEYVQTSDGTTSRIRPNLFYEAPLGIQGYTFLEMYLEETGSYYGETYLLKSLGGQLSWLGIRTDLYHSSFFKNYAGIGVYLQPIATDRFFLELKYVPLHVQYEGMVVQKNNGVIGYFLTWNFTAPLFGEFSLLSFQNINIHAAGGPQWCYGEAYLYKPIRNFSLGAGADFRGVGTFTPQLNWGLILQYRFPKKE